MEEGDIERNSKSHKQVSWLIGLFVFCVENGEGKRDIEKIVKICRQTIKHCDKH